MASYRPPSQQPTQQPQYVTREEAVRLVKLGIEEVVAAMIPHAVEAALSGKRPGVMKTQEVAGRLGVDDQTCLRWERKGLIPAALPRVGRPRCWDRQEFERWEAGRRLEAAAQKGGGGSA